MASSKSLPACLAVLAVLLADPALAPGRTSRSVKAAAISRPLLHLLSRSRELWATIDVCNAADQPNTVGIRGSMPGDGQARGTMYMRFRLQYMNTTTKQWVDLANGAAPGFAAVGPAKSVRQAGRSFQLMPVAGKPAVTLRGVVNFQWRAGTTVLASASRPTTAGRQSLAGADPANFSAATCLIG
jgi:hypothetical protein